jgi:hypothetical protein
VVDEHQNLHELLEDHSAGDARPVAAQQRIGMIIWLNRAAEKKRRISGEGRNE